MELQSSGTPRPDEVYTYYTRMAVVGSVLLFVGAGAFMAVFLYGAAFGELTFNGHPATSGERVFAALFALVTLGLFMYIAAHGFMRSRNERIEFGKGEIVWTDARGRERVRCRLEDVTGLRRVPLYVNDLVRYEIDTRCGVIRYLEWINRRSELQARVESLFEAPKEAPPIAPPISGRWQARTEYRYRHPMLLLFGLVFGGFILFGAVSALTGMASTGSTSPIVFVLASSPFLLVPYFFLGAFFFERIWIDGDELVWTDRHGRERLRARLDELQSVDEQKGEASLTRVYTRQGEIRFSSYLSHYRELVNEVRRLTGVPDLP